MSELSDIEKRISRLEDSIESLKSMISEMNSRMEINFSEIESNSDFIINHQENINEIKEWASYCQKTIDTIEEWAAEVQSFIDINTHGQSSYQSNKKQSSGSEGRDQKNNNRYSDSNNLSEYEKAIRILGLSVGASEYQIKSSYYKLAKKYHPDSGKTPDIKKMQEINWAFEFLSNYKEAA
jgi:chromosome segregation ATPase